MEKTDVSSLEESANIDYYIQRLGELFFSDRTDLYLEEVGIVGI